MVLCKRPALMISCPQVDTKQRAYETIMQVIKDKTEEGSGSAAVDYYEAARMAYTNGQYMKKYLDSKINDISEINNASD